MLTCHAYEREREMLSGMSSNYSSHRVLTPAGVSRKRKEREALDAPKPAHDNRLLAGYLAHEFLTKGTIFGRKWDPARAEHAAPADFQKPSPTKPGAYADVAHLLKTDGAHIPGIVNPSQLARWLQM